ncbi:hypothetical protein MPTK1_1g14720 [Marchantia polymorpha subsp. ruderalis]|uniref:NTF2-like domain-containing protein n=2 Tax=Marchantia polymorpha TaxID=3197 RepID=A0AAF6AQ80_MARPO|nr:hypothetical protein MARPO_0153s0018 [Marchantia polymorpha]BBM98600.1 hypothetical protein Mp_1g14720 [Marchantia polymorpha subsp. ruderalis]|eukprot:PTQ28850.1 hypothetical protein MARPO_0153s0018 [Marchantia polymorpha]
MQPTSTSACGLAFSTSSLLAPSVLQPRCFPRISNAGHGVCSSSAPKKLRSVVCKSNDEKRTPPTAEASPLVKLAWYGSEAFGNAVATFRPKSGEDQADDDGELKFDGPVSREDAVDLIKKDFDRSYFVTGNMATGIYENDCEFADPFVSFKGLKRFRQNVGNLGSFMEESSLKLTEWQEYEDRIYARWRFNCVLSLPWRPILAATGSTEYFFNKDSGKIYKHVESWDISPADGVRQLFKPNPRHRK